MSFFAELKRRNVVKVSIAYVVMAWLVMQVTDIILNNVEAPSWGFYVIVLLLGIGFLFAIFFAWAFELTPEGIKREHEVDRSQSITPQTGKKLNLMITGVMALALAYFAYDKFVLASGRESAAIESAMEVATSQALTENLTSGETAAAPGKTIAVLPFVNMSSDAEQEYFSDGISEEILNALAKVKELQVTGRTSSFAFKGQNKDLRQIGEALGVENILEGSVRKSGNTVRITAQLIRVDNGFHLWSETYDRELDNVFAIQDEIATNILQHLKATLLEGEETTVIAARANPEAYELYLLAKQRMYERTGPTIESAADLLDRAIAIDPDYAPAYAQRGIATLLLSASSGAYGDIPIEQAQAQGKLYLFDHKGQLLKTVSELQRPTGLAYDHSSGRLFVAETLAHQVVVFDSDGNRLFEFGARGTNDGEFNFPSHLSVSGDKLLVNDNMNFQIKTFSLDGRELAVFGKHGDSSGQFSQPKGVAADSMGNIYVAGATIDRIQVFSAGGDFLLAFGGEGNAPGKFLMPAGIAIQNDRIYVADSYNGRVQVFQFMGGD